MSNIDTTLAINLNKALNNENISANQLAQPNATNTEPPIKKKQCFIDILKNIIPSDKLPKIIEDNKINTRELDRHTQTPIFDSTNDSLKIKESYKDTIEAENRALEETHKLRNHLTKKQDIDTIESKMSSIKSEIRQEETIALATTKKNPIAKKFKNFTQKIRNKTSFLNELISMRAKKLHSPLDSLENNNHLANYTLKFGLNSKRKFSFER